MVAIQPQHSLSSTRKPNAAGEDGLIKEAASLQFGGIHAANWKTPGSNLAQS